MIETVISKLSVPCWGKSALEVDNMHREVIDILEYVLTANDYQEAAVRTANKNLNSLQQLQNGLMGLNGESGEVIDLLKKHLFQGHSLDVEHIAKELGDIAWYLAISAYAIDYDLEAIMQINIDKLIARYPLGFDSESSIHRNTDDI